MRIFPEKYEELDINKYDKQLMAAIKRYYRDDSVATFMLSCNPSKTKDGIVDVLITCEGILCFKIVSDITEELLMPKLFERQMLQQHEEQIILDRMKMHKVMVRNNTVSDGSIGYLFKSVL